MKGREPRPPEAKEPRFVWLVGVVWLASISLTFLLRILGLSDHLWRLIDKVDLVVMISLTPVALYAFWTSDGQRRKGSTK